MQAAYRQATKSPDKSTQVGAVICDSGWNVAYGYNDFMPGFGNLPRDHERPLKYSLVEHAERNAIFAAVRKNVNLKGLTMYANWASCPDCARAIVLSGLGEVIVHRACMLRTPERWRELVDTGLLILKRGGVKVTEWSGVVGGVKNLNNGEWWCP